MLGASPREGLITRVPLSAALVCVPAGECAPGAPSAVGPTRPAGQSLLRAFTSAWGTRLRSRAQTQWFPPRRLSVFEAAVLDRPTPDGVPAAHRSTTARPRARIVHFVRGVSVCGLSNSSVRLFVCCLSSLVCGPDWHHGECAPGVAVSRRSGDGSIFVLRRSALDCLHPRPRLVFDSVVVCELRPRLDVTAVRRVSATASLAPCPRLRLVFAFSLSAYRLRLRRVCVFVCGPVSALSAACLRPSMAQ